MAFDIIKEQRMIRTLFHSLISAANFVAENKEQREQFVKSVATFVRERSLVEDDTREKCDLIKETLETLGWKSVKIAYKEGDDQGKVHLGKNRYIPNDLADSNGVLLVLQGLFSGLCYHLVKGQVKVKAELSLLASSFYDISFVKSKDLILEVPETKKTPVPTSETIDSSVHDNFSLEQLFNPIFTRDIPTMILFDTAWKVIRESYIANAPGSELNEQEELKEPSMKNLSRLIKKLTENVAEEEILNMAEIIGEFFAKLLKTKISEPLLNKLQPTLTDKHASSYLIYYECRHFCAENQFTNRCIFVRGMWVGILGEILGFPIKIKEVLHAGKRDRYCMLELVPEQNT